jgi:MFS family permease
VALAGIALAGLGTSVCAPVLIGIGGRTVDERSRGAAVSIVTTIAYLGFLVGPAAVGLVSDAAGLRAGLALLAAVALALAVAVRLVPAGAGASRPAEA